MYPSAEKILHDKGIDLPRLDQFKAAQEKLKQKQRGLAGLMQKTSPLLRKLPESVRGAAELAHSVVSVGSSLGQTSKTDLLESMERNGISKSIVIAHPPVIPNEFILKECANEPRLLPVVNIPLKEKSPKERLTEYYERGAIALKIHASSDGMPPNNAFYNELVATADELGLPVIIHTGCFKLRPIFKEPELGNAENFKFWFTKFPKTKFVLAHLNYQDPEKAIEYCKRYENVYADVSWQDADIIKLAMKETPEKIMFGSDWPLVGDNQTVMAQRLNQAGLDQEEMAKISSDTAFKVFGQKALGL